MWTITDRELIDLGGRELQELGLAQESDIEDGFVVKMPKAHPVYDFGYEQSLRVVRTFLKGLKNLQLIGRNGMHKYNNQDHLMLTAMLGVENILARITICGRSMRTKNTTKALAPNGRTIPPIIRI